MNFEKVLLYVMPVWMFLITAVFIWLVIIYRKLTRNINKGNLVRILDLLYDREKLNAKEIEEIKRRIGKIENESLTHIQKIAVRRFNPFNELGGDQSFSLGMTDAQDNGIIITGLHTRERTRVYIKNITKGKSELDLSQEEEKVLKSILGKK